MMFDGMDNEFRIGVIETEPQELREHYDINCERSWARRKFTVTISMAGPERPERSPLMATKDDMKQEIWTGRTEA